ncbi:MAG TPA: nucleotide exchange factor GrpE [Armatimonadota bacterium]|nr:nucleotide exchange factor GrpE [Armatimonadota bacterium]
MSDQHHDFDELTPETEADIAEGAAEAAAPLDDEVIHLRAALADAQQALATARNDYLRAHADFDNFRKRMRAERDQEFSRGGDRVLAELLPILDDFERALAAVNDASTVESLRQGVTLIYRQLQSLLERYGITPMAVEGQPFDPMFHDAVASVTTADVPDHTITSEVQRGYLKNGDAFRPAKVVVAMQPFDEQA